ncbi:MAG: hypothetical protein Q7T48_23035 [Cellvibrio sp.]|uniref:hypothetical protein n=1 Tax=Cellvibrio sp. TaxID=1965322 RepID=UPI00271E686B|nr:hypothetical protein [Cellvibrio sp.]
MFIKLCMVKKSAIKKLRRLVLSWVAVTLLAPAAAAVPDRFTLSLGAQEYWDSNFARTADVDSEHYTRSVASLAFNEQLSKQDFSLGVSGNRYEYAQRDDLDVDFYKGNAHWRSEWSQRVKTSLNWTRDAYVVDRLEFASKDVVSLDNFTGQIILGTNKHVGITLGGRQVAQTHSNELREFLDFDEEEWFVAGTYTTANKSFLSLRLREGERWYVHMVPGDLRMLDFDYRQLELEGSWALTRKTQLGFTVGRFKREGEINDGTGTVALVDLAWAISEKLKLALSYSQSEPAAGETSDSPADVRTSKIALNWELSSKWLFSMDAGYSDQTYLPRLALPARDETITTFSPLALTYKFSELINIRFDSQWVDRESPLLYRDYDYALASLGLTLVF